MMIRKPEILFAAGLFALGMVILDATQLYAQAVCLPAPRLMTTYPMGAQKGTTVEVTVSGQYSENVRELLFSHPGITAEPIPKQKGKWVSRKFKVTVAAGCPVGIYEARLLTRLGVSTARAFNVGALPEVTRQKPNTSIANAMTLEPSCICNAFTTRQAIDYYRFKARKGDRIFVECAAKRIDSKLKPVLIIGDSEGADLLVERRGGALDFVAPEDGEFTVKIHDLTYNGGNEYFYRLSLRKSDKNEVVRLHPATRNVNAFSWPPNGHSSQGLVKEKEPNHQKPMQMNLPFQVEGTFFPAADVDAFEFEAKKGETWWIEVASGRLGRPTDPSIVVQQVDVDDGNEKVTDLTELTDILSPVKVSSNGYSYDGPPYNAGSSDIIGSFTAKQTGKHRIQLTDLFGGTRSDIRNRYKMIVRKAQPDFALVSWSLHMNLRNGDRNALSKPIALRRGAAMILEVVVVRRDGFTGPIDLAASNLPRGVTATGIRIPANQTRGYFVISADGKAPVGYSMIELSGVGEIDGKKVTRQCHWSSMRWPVKNAWSEIPNPRLVGNIPVSVSDSEYAPLSLVANEEKIWEVQEGGTLTIPLVHTKRCDFSGANLTLKTLGASLSRNPAFDASLSADITEAKLDLKKTKTKPGEYVLSFYGSAVAKYQFYPQGVKIAETELASVTTELQNLEAKSKRLGSELKTATAAAKPKLVSEQKATTAQVAAMKVKLKAAEKKVAFAKMTSKPKDIVDIIVSKPIKIKVVPAKKESTP